MYGAQLDRYLIGPVVLTQQNQMIIKGIKYINNSLAFKTRNKKLFLKSFRKNV